MNFQLIEDGLNNGVFKMKKRYCILIVLIIIFSACSDQYENWNSVEIADVGSFKIPPDMSYEKSGETIYLKDIDGNICMVGVVREGDVDSKLSDAFGEEMIYQDLVSSEVFSNSATVGKCKFLISGVDRELIFLDLYSSSDERLYLVAKYDMIDYNLVSQIGKSFVMVTNEE